jgi:hypothetical protein
VRPTYLVRRQYLAPQAITVAPRRLALPAPATKRSFTSQRAGKPSRFRSGFRPPAKIQEIEFAPDSPLEQAGFELPVPLATVSL